MPTKFYSCRACVHAKDTGKYRLHSWHIWLAIHVVLLHADSQSLCKDMASKESIYIGQDVLLLCYVNTVTYCCIDIIRLLYNFANVYEETMKCPFYPCLAGASHNQHKIHVFVLAM